MKCLMWFRKEKEARNKPGRQHLYSLDGMKKANNVSVFVYHLCEHKITNENQERTACLLCQVLSFSL